MATGVFVSFVKKKKDNEDMVTCFFFLEFLDPTGFVVDFRFLEFNLHTCCLLRTTVVKISF